MWEMVQKTNPSDPSFLHQFSMQETLSLSDIYCEYFKIINDPIRKIFNSVRLWATKKKKNTSLYQTSPEYLKNCDP